MSEAKMIGALRLVNEFRQELAAVRPGAIDLVALETRVQEVTNAMGLELMREVLVRADEHSPEVVIAGERWGNRRSTPERYATMFGDIEVERGIYQRRGRGRVAVPLELRLGMVEGRYTPRLARVMTRATALMTSEESADFLSEVGVAKVSAATLHRVPRAIAARYEERREQVDEAIREEDDVPDGVFTVQVGIDGVMVPQDGEHTRPRGRTAAVPEPPRHEQRYGPSKVLATAANDGAGGRPWHEGSVGTLALFDATGRRLRTLYFAQMPESGKITMAHRLEVELQALVSEKPSLNICFASDGAPQHWSLLKAIHERLPPEAIGDVAYLVDFYHVAEHLQKAAEAIAGVDTPEARVMSAGWRETLKELPDGTTRVLKALRYQRGRLDGKAGRSEVHKAIKYLARQARNGRTAFAHAAQRGWPIGTGITEAAAKTVVNVRMKRAGSRFSQHGGQTVMLFRTAILSHRFHALSRQLEATYVTHIKAA